jgi:hypothetical protein
VAAASATIVAADSTTTDTDSAIMCREESGNRAYGRGGAVVVEYAVRVEESVTGTGGTKA